MAHIVRGPHDEKFYTLLDELKEETELLMASGYRGEGFYSNGQQLGSQSVPRYLSNGIAAKAAEKRLQTSKIMLPTGGIRLGGGSSNSKNMTPAQLAARAAQKRQLDKVWCGGSVEESSTSAPVSSSASPAAVPSSPSDNVTLKRKLSFDTLPEMDTQSKRRDHRAIIDLTTANEDEWSCPTCTFLNGSIKLVCQICLTERFLDHEIVIEDTNFWSCPQCTLKNEKKWSTCIACQYVQLQ